MMLNVNNRHLEAQLQFVAPSAVNPGDTATYWLKIAYFCYHISFGGLAPYVPFGNFAVKLYNRQETTVTGLSSSEDRMIVAGVVLA